MGEFLHQQAKIIEKLPASIISTDLHGYITSYNKSSQELFGYSAEEALGKHISFLYPEEEHNFLQNQVIDPLKDKSKHNTDVKVRKKSGEEFYINLSLSLLRDKTYTPVGMIGYFKEHASASHAANENLIKEIEEHIDGIIGIIDLLTEGELTAKQKECRETARKSAEILLGAINNILALSKIEEGKRENKMPDTELSDEKNKIFDRHDLLSRLIGDEALAKEIVDIFLQNTPSLIELMKQSFIEGNIDVLERYAHTLKGSAANTGAMSIKHIAIEIQMAAKKNSTKLIPHLFEQLDREFVNFKKFILPAT